jgi:flagellar hook-associated protein 2
MASSTSGTTGGNRMSGLMSGLDTESLVKAMASNSLQKIRSRQAKQQKLTWQQEGIQAIISKLKDFQDKYLSLTSKESVRLRSNLQKMNAVSSSSAVNATASSSTPSGTYTIRAATAAKATTVATAGENVKMGNGSVNLDFSKSNEDKDYTAKITIDGNTKTITYRGGTGTDADGKTVEDRFEEKVNAAFASTLGSNKIKIEDGVLSYEESTADPIDHVVNIGYNEALGLKNDASTMVTSSSTLNSINFTTTLDKSNVYRININGKDLDFSGSSSISSIVSAINGADAGVKASFNTLSGKFSISSTDTGSGSEIKITQKTGNLVNALFNVDKVTVAAGTSNVSDRLTYDTYGSVSATLSKSFAEALGDGLDEDQDATMTLKIDGNDYQIDLKALFPKSEGEVTWGEFTTGVKDEIKRIATAEHGINTVDAEKLASEITVKVSPTDLSFSFTSSKHEISLSASEDTSVWSLGDKSNNVTKNQYTETMSPFKNADGSVIASMTFNTSDGAKTITAADAEKGITIKELKDSGLFDYTSGGYLMAAKGAVFGIDAGAQAFMEQMFGDAATVTDYPADGTNVLDKTDTTAGAYTAGADAMLTIEDPEGQTATYQNASSVFNISGLSVNVEKLKDFTSIDDPADPTDVPSDPITIEVSKDNSAVKDVVVKFVEAYNEIIKEVNTIVNETRPKSGKSYYEPLTEEQKEEMSEEEIEKWESQAKKGLLANDNNLRRVLDDMNNSMLSVAGFTIFDMGITLSDSRTSGNTYTIDETKLDEAINKYGDKIANFFTDATNGLATKMNKAVDGMISTSANKYGYLTQVAGVPDTLSATNNTLYNQIEEYNKLIASLQTRYQNETDRYWAQFTRMEKLLAQFSDQSAAFAQG